MKRFGFLALAFAIVLSCLPAHARTAVQTYRDYVATVHHDDTFQIAQSPVLPGPGLPVAGGVTPATQTFVAFATENSGSATVSYAGVSFGTANVNRVLAIVPMARSAVQSSVSTTTKPTIGGITATQVPSAAGNVAANQMATDVWYASVPAGASGTITVTWNNATVRTGVYVYSIITTTPTPTVGVGAAANSVTSLALPSMTVPANGVGIVGGVTQNTQTPSTLGFTNATFDSQDALMGAANTSEAGHTTSTGSVTVTMTGSASNSLAISGAAWGP